MAVGKEWFLGSVSFETEGSPLSLTFWNGKDVHQFFTPFIAAYPAKWRRKKDEDETLEELLSSKGFLKSQSFDIMQDEFYKYSAVGGRDIFFLDKTEFSKLPHGVRDRFDKNYKQSLRWDFGYLPIVKFNDRLYNILEEKKYLDGEFKCLFSEISSINRNKNPIAIKSAVDAINDFYYKHDFEDILIERTMAALGYVMDKDVLLKFIHIFKNTKFSIENLDELISSEKDTFEPLSVEARTSDKILEQKEYYTKFINEGFTDRLFAGVTRVFGKSGLTKSSKLAYDYVQKDNQHYVFDKLKELFKGREKYLFDQDREEEYSRDIKYQLEELFQFIHDRSIESRTQKDIKKLIKKKEAPPELSHLVATALFVEEKRLALTKNIANLGKRSSIEYDYSHQRMRLLLDIMSRNDPHMITFDGIEKAGSLSYHDFLNQTVLGLMDIEKPQYGSIKEKIEDIATIVKDTKGNVFGQLDTLRETKSSNIRGFTVRTHKYVKDLVESSAEFLNAEGASTLITYGNYDLKHTKDTEKYELSGGGSKEDLAKQRVSVKFMERYEIIGSSINLLSLIMNVAPQFPNHKLATTINFLKKRAELDDTFKKIFTHDELRRADKKSEHLLSTGVLEDRLEALDINEQIGIYTVDDVKELFEVLLNKKNTWLFEDLFDVSYAFGITLDQAASNKGTTVNALAKRTYFDQGHFLDKGDHTPAYRLALEKTRESYKKAKIERLQKYGVTFSEEHGLFSGVDKLYFAPELSNPELFRGFPDIMDFVKKTLYLHDSERQIGRLNYVKPIVLHMITDLALLNQSVNEKEFKRRKWFFKRVYGIGSDTAKSIIHTSYAEAAEKMAELGIKPLVADADFIYTKQQVPDQELLHARLFRGLSGLNVYKMSQGDYVYKFNGKYSNLPGAIEDSGFRKTLFELELTRDVLDKIFSRDEPGAIELVKSAYARLHSMNHHDSELAQKLLLFNRSKNRYIGVIGSSGDELLKAEFTPDAKKSFQPDLEYYLGEYSGKVFGITNRYLDITARMPKLLSGIIYMGEENKGLDAIKYSNERKQYAQQILSEKIFFETTSQPKGQIELF